MIEVSILGGSGYAGGELLRLLLTHPKAKIKQITSRRFAKQSVSLVHPNLRGVCSLTFCDINDLQPCDLLFVALPNGESMKIMKRLMSLSPKIIDLAADFRLNNTTDWQNWYQTPHHAPALLGQFVYGLPEIKAEEIKSANLVACPGCEAIVSILCLYPFIKHQLIKKDLIIIDAKMSSSQAGNEATPSSHHPERSRVVRSYQPVNHRHSAEIEQLFNQSFKQKIKVDISATAIEMVRGILVTIHTFLKKPTTEKEIWQILRQECQNKPFIRIVKEKQGLYRFPEPKILQGTNYCDLGFAKEVRGNRLVIIGAIDNLVKGTAGNAIQCMNLMFGFNETMSLEFPGLHPI